MTFTAPDDEYLHDLTWHAALRQRRVQLGLSLRDVSRLTGLSNAFVSQLERGRVRRPASFFLFMGLLSAYDMDPVEYYNKYNREE